MTLPLLPPLLLLMLAATGSAIAAGKDPSESTSNQTPPGLAPPKTPVLCTIPKSDAEGSFYVVAAPNLVCPKSIAVNEPVYAILECFTGANSATCEAWPRVYAVNPGDEDRLQYEWTVRVGWTTTTYPPHSNPTISFHCPGIQAVSVTVRVSNGTASDLDIIGFRCGDEPL